MLAAVIIPHYNDPVRLRLCLDALVPQITDDVEVVVVDNGSKADLTEIISTYPKVSFFIESKKGAAHARNTGVEKTSASRLFFLDSDCVPAPDWIKKALKNCDVADIVGGQIHVFDDTPPPRTGAQSYEAVFAFNQKAYIEQKQFSVTANLLTTRSLFDKAGGFRAGVSEDVDWCHRAISCGATIAYAPDVCVMHPSRPDWQSLEKKWSRLMSEMYHLNGTDARARMIWAARAIAVAGSSLVDCLAILQSSKLNSSVECWRGIATLFKLRSKRALWMLRQSLLMDH